jgi:hypothetical protein
MTRIWIGPPAIEISPIFDDFGRPGLQDQIGVIDDKAVSTAAHIHAGPGPIGFSENQGSE